MAAILKFRLPVTSGNTRNNAIDILGPKTWLYHLEFPGILYRTRDISTYGLATANGRHLEIPTSGYIGQYLE